MQVYREIFANYGDLLRQRSEATARRLAEAVAKPGARPLTVGLYQMENCCGGAAVKAANLERMLAAGAAAAAAGVQLLAFPELCLPGYLTYGYGTPADAVAAAQELADEPSHSPALQRLQAAAAEWRMVLVFGFSERAGNLVYNAIGVIDADGRWLGCRRKNPLYPYDYELLPFAQPPTPERSAVFRTQVATFGVSNCFDGEFPETIRQMRLDGAELLVWCNAAVGDSRLGTSHRVNHAGSHAQGNWMYVVCCNCAADKSSGTSCIIDVTGEPLVILPPREEALGITRLDLAASATWSCWRDRLCREGVVRQRHLDAK